MPTIKDIASLAGVSICTVSRYLNNKIAVRRETEERILAAIDQLGYVPNAVAQSLKRSSTNNIAVIVPRITSSYYADMTGGISGELAKRDYNLFIYEVEHMNKTEREILQLMRENMVAGVIFIGMSYDFSFLGEIPYLLSCKIPVVYANRLVDYAGYPLIYPDFVKVGQLAVEHLLSRGRRRLALIHKHSYDSAAPHVQGFRDAVAAAGLPEPNLLQATRETDSADRCARSLMEQGIDGVFVQNELLAVGVIKALARQGVQVPGQISVLGFGNSVVGELSTPELSCIDLQNHQLGVLSARLMLRQIAHKAVEPVTVLEPSILPRAST